MKIAFRAAILAATCWSASALAGDAVLYEATPGWVEVAELPDSDSGPAFVLYDQQVWLGEGVVHTYSDMAIRVDNPQMLNTVGTLQAQWMPDKGDLTIHRVQILRDGEIIDVIGQGAKFDVLRREMQLERKLLDGSLTATMPVPGLRVGDTLRLSYTVSNSDQALGDEVQSYSGIAEEPLELGFGRTRVMWDDGLDVRWQARNGVEPIEPTSTLDSGVEFIFPVPEGEDMPYDAPRRYHFPAMLQAGTFSDWGEVNAVMAPYYTTEGLIAADPQLVGVVDGIRSRSSDELAQAVDALKIVQDDVSYLLNGLDGGNYIPQSPSQTWELRYGDCKAKTLLLLSMLRELGIEAEPVLVSIMMGDAVPGMLPMPGAFDHVVVRATIDGKDYWLDGTSTGASMANVADVPDFHWGLPLTVGADELVTIEARPQSSIDRDMRVTFDQRAGLMLPALVDVEMTLTGPSASQLRALADEPESETKTERVESLAGMAVGRGFVLLDYEIDAPENDATVTLTLSGFANTSWKTERGRAKQGVSLPTSNFGFSPDRARKAWREIPVTVDGPSSQRKQVTYLLPETAEAYEIDGKGEFDTSLATVQLRRTSEIAPGRITVTDFASYPGGEIAAAEIPKYRSEAARFGSLDFSIRAPESVSGYSDIVDSDPARFAPIDAALSQAIADEPDEVYPYRSRASFRGIVLNRQGAIEDLTMAIDLEGSASDYLDRAGHYYQLGMMDEALADMQMAFDLSPDTGHLIGLANVMMAMGMDEEAYELMASWDGGDAEERRSLAFTLSEADAKLGRKDKGLARIEDILATRPGDGDALNAKCWYLVTWDIGRDQMEEACTDAVEKADYSPPVLDSRGLAYYRLGRFDEALADFDAALALEPNLSATLYMRGLTRLRMGDSGGQQDVDRALKITPGLERQYKVWGIPAS